MPVWWLSSAFVAYSLVLDSSCSLYVHKNEEFIKAVIWICGINCER